MSEKSQTGNLSLDRRELSAICYDFMNKILHVRDRLQVIAAGERDTSRQVRHKEYGWLMEGKKKLKLSEAQEIARLAIVAIDEAINEFDEQTRNI